MSTDLNSLPLQDRARAAEKLTRELLNKIENDYLVKVRSLREMTDPEAERPVGDLTIREGVRKVFESDAALDDTWQNVRAHLQSIRDQLNEIAHLE